MRGRIIKYQPRNGKPTFGYSFLAGREEKSGKPIQGSSAALPRSGSPGSPAQGHRGIREHACEPAGDAHLRRVFPAVAQVEAQVCGALPGAGREIRHPAIRDVPRCRSNKRQYQIAATQGPRPKTALSPAEGPPDGRHRDRISGLQKSSLKCVVPSDSCAERKKLLTESIVSFTIIGICGPSVVTIGPR